MKIKIEIEMNTDDQKDRVLIEKIVYQIDQVKEILEKLDQSLNKGNRRNKE